MRGDSRKVILTVHDPLSSRVMFDCGIAEMLAEKLEGNLEIAATFDIREHAAWQSRVKSVRIRSLPEIGVGMGGLKDRLASRWDAALDRQIGFLPVAIRLNLKYGFHRERMERGHSNGYLNSDNIGLLPRWAACYDFMFRWLYGRGRHLWPGFYSYLQDNASAVITSHLQHQTTVPFIVGAKRLGIPLVGYIASWDHLVGKGGVYPAARRYIVQNEIMKGDLERYHGIASEVISVTGWPQSDIFARRRSRADYLSLIAGFGLDATKPCVLVTGNSITNAPYEPAFFKRLVEWWENGDGHSRMNLIFRPHPKDACWRERYALLLSKPRQGVFLQVPSYEDLDVLALMLQHVDCVVTNAGTILLDSVVNGRPAISVLYDEGAPTGVCYAIKSVVGEHYKEMMESQSFYRATDFAQVVEALTACLQHPLELQSQRRAASQRLMGDVDGKAAARVVRAMMEGVGRQGKDNA